MTDGARVHTVLATGAGRDGLVRRLVEVPAGSRFEGAAGPGGELWFVIAGAGQLSPGAAGQARQVGRDTGLWLPPGAGYRVSADGPDLLTLDSVSPPGEPHCLENTGRATLRVLGVFHPGGSPASKQQAPAS